MYRASLQCLLAILFLLLANSAFAAASGYLCITDSGYKGESIAPGFTNCSDVTDFGQTGFVDGSTPIARAFKLDKNYDSMSNPLRTAMVSLTTLNEVKIRLTKPTAAGTAEFYDVRLLGAHVDSATVAWGSGSSGASPTETIGFSYASIEVKYVPVNGTTGALGTPIYTCWNVAANTAQNGQCP